MQHLSLLELWTSMSWFPRGRVRHVDHVGVVTGIAMNKWMDNPERRRRRANSPLNSARFLQEEQMDGAIALAVKYKKSHVARTLVGALEEIKAAADRRPDTVADINSAERAIERNMMIIQAELKRGMGILPRLARQRRSWAARYDAGHRERLHRHGGGRRVRWTGGGGGRHRRGADHHGVWLDGRHPGGVAVQLLSRPRSSS